MHNPFTFAFPRKYSLDQIFTPTRAATFTYVERPALDYELRRCLNLPGTQIVLFGHTGGGKTTLVINELNKLRRKFVTTSCVEGMTVDGLIASAFDQLGAFYAESQSSCEATS